MHSMTLRRAWRLALRAALLLGFFYALLALRLVWDGLHDELAPADLAIIFGNTVEPDGRPSERLQARLERGLALYRAGLAERLLVSGGLGREGHDEALVMQAYLVERGVPAERIDVDSAGLTTYDTARNAVALMRARGLRSVIVVTQYFHIPRARLALQRAGAGQVYSAHADYFEPRDLYSTVRELPAYLDYLLRSYE